MMSAEPSRLINFGAGPSALPDSVLGEATKGLFNFSNTGVGIAEISHRSPEFTAFLSDVTALVRSQLSVPPTHSILFTQGGGTAQFSAVVLNLLARHRLLFPDLKNRSLDYVLTGSWSKSAYEEGCRLSDNGDNYIVNAATDGRNYSEDGKSFDSIPPHESYKFSENPALIYYCENETIDGVQFRHDVESVDKDGKSVQGTFPFHLLPQDRLVPLVGDYSSSFMSRPIPRLADHAVIFAGAQKNIGPAGLTILIVRNDCIVDVDAAVTFHAQPVPRMMAYKTLADSKSVYNTPPVLSIYISGLVLKRSSELGGVEYYEALNRRKAQKVYGALRDGEEKGVFKGRVQPESASWMNVVFTVLGKDKEKAFLEGAEVRGMIGIKGHRWALLHCLEPFVLLTCMAIVLCFFCLDSISKFCWR